MKLHLLAVLALAVGILSPPLVSAATSAKTVKVEIHSFAFEPAQLAVNVGDVIEFTNHDLVPHTATGDHKEWDTGLLVNGAVGRVAVTHSGNVSFHCLFHPQMKGTITIAAPAKAAAHSQKGSAS